MLLWLKLLHTAVWCFFVGCILGIPLAAWSHSFGWAGARVGLVLVECGVLVWNGGRCPITDLAAVHTEDRAANFDIFLPEWLARYNKQIFGTLFAGGLCYAMAEWWIARR
jgi:hypothetical protein